MDLPVRPALNDLVRLLESVNQPVCLLAEDLSLLYANSRSSEVSYGADVTCSFDEYCRRQLAAHAGTDTSPAPRANLPVACLRVDDWYVCLGKPAGTPDWCQAGFYRSVVEEQRELICRLDQSGRITFANSALCTFLNSTAADLTGASLSNLAAPGSPLDLAEVLARDHAELDDSTIEFELATASRPRLVRWAVRILRDITGNVEGLQLTGHDITDQRVYYEELLDYQNQLRHLTARLMITEEYERRRLSDQMNETVCRSLAGVQERLLRAVDLPAGEERSAEVEEAAEQLARIQDSAHALTFEMSPPILSDMGFVAALEWLASSFSNRHGIKIEFIDDGHPKHTNSELHILLYHSARELLANTVKHAEAERATLSLSQSGGTIELTVEDDGRGFNPADVTPPGDQPAGFGHFTIAERVRQLGGRFEVISAPGSGTRAVIRVPLASEASSEPPPVSATHPGLRHHPESAPAVRIVLVDDREIVRDGLKNLLRNYRGLEIIGEASGAAEAVELANRFKPDVVVVNTGLPGADCLETVQGVSGLDPAAQVIVLAAQCDRRQMREILKSGAAGFLLKDTEPEDLVNALRSTRSALRCFSSLAYESIVTDFIRFDELSVADRQEVLSNREREVLGLISDGLATKEIALRLGLSIKTIETYRRRIMEKLDIDSVAGLVKYALREGLVASGSSTGTS